MKKFLIVLGVALGLIISQNNIGASNSNVVHRGMINSLAWNVDSQSLALQGAEGTWVYGIDKTLIKYLEEVDSVSLEGGGIPPDIYSSAWGTGVDWHPDGDKLVTPFYDPNSLASILSMSLKIWDVSNWEIITTYSMGFDSTAIRWSPDGEQVAVADRGLLDVSGIRSWTISFFPGQENHPIVLNLGEIPIHDIDWNSASNQIAVARSDGAANIINVDPLRAMYIDEETNLQTFHIQDDAINTIKWKPEEELVVTGGDEGLIYLWDANTGEVVSTFEASSGSINAVDWSSDGTLLANAGEDAIIRIWDVETGEVIATFEGHEDEIIDLDWSPDDQHIATASLDDTVRIWEVDLMVND